MALRRAILAAVLAHLATRAAVAQEVRGRALAPGSAASVAGVIVTLVDEAGLSVARTLTSDSGAFRLRAPRPDRYWLRALRIGFRPTVSPPFALAIGQTLERDVELDTRAVTLAAVQVAAERTCRVRPDSSSAAFAAWEEARKALDASLLTRGRRYTMEVVRFERFLSPRTEAALSEHEVEGRGASTRPFVAVPLAQLDSMGYVQREPEWTTYRGPDEEVLLSEQFAATHCLHLAEAAAGDEVSLAFEPVRERTLSDIRGTLALDRTTGALRRLEFTFVNVGREVERERAGGRVYFRQLPSGGWIIDRWVMRYPLLQRGMVQRAGSMGEVRQGLLRREETLELQAMHETGGEVTEVARGDTVLWQVERPRLTGVVGEESGALIAGATVRIPTLGRHAVTDADGRFAMAAVRRGRRSLLVATPLLDSLGLPPIARDADTRVSPTVTLVLPARDALFESACALPANEARRLAAEGRRVGLVRGVTRGEHGERVGGVRIVVTWFQNAAGSRLDPLDLGVTRTLETVSSVTGDYTLCGVRPDQPLTVRTWIGGDRVGEVTARVPPDSRLLLLDLTARRAAP
jgi:hypothetical protein